jgi:hypothetical protein
MSMFGFGSSEGDDKDGGLFGMGDMAKRLSVLDIDLTGLPSPDALFGGGEEEKPEEQDTESVSSYVPKAVVVQQESIFKRFKLAPQGRLVSRPVRHPLFRC